MVVMVVPNIGLSYQTLYNVSLAVRWIQEFDEGIYV